MAEDAQKLLRVATPSTSSMSETEDLGSALQITALPKKSCLKKRPMALDTSAAVGFRSLENRAHFLNHGLKSPTGSKTPSSSCRTIGQAMIKSVSTGAVADFACTGRSIEGLGDRKAGVSWAASPKSAKCVTPYGQTYGQHPRFFNFDRKGRMQPTAEAISAMVEEDMSPPVDKNGMIVIR
eukprot:TRINITY_DN14514_c0_g2_i2.p1 TRINITY_DN14514_c0_g2~~TRINITY_DN14514_c0_g2_i2.p1  ORF type:complete len:181 (-),score=28.39 TRINITY_DN14514_c0_g2_i2:139-681(-)